MYFTIPIILQQQELLDIKYLRAVWNNKWYFLNNYLQGLFCTAKIYAPSVHPNEQFSIKNSSRSQFCCSLFNGLPSLLSSTFFHCLLSNARNFTLVADATPKWTFVLVAFQQFHFSVIGTIPTLRQLFPRNCSLTFNYWWIGRGISFEHVLWLISEVRRILQFWWIIRRTMS